MDLTVIAVGTRMSPWVQEGWTEYARRFSRGLALRLKEIPMARRARNADVAALQKTECNALESAVPAGHRVIALDERGTQWSTEELAGQLERWMRDEHGVSFLVGGPDGLTDDCRKAADNVWALGRLVLPHPLVRVILAEQLYRAWTITQNHPYHRK
ncbi:MAG: 23S rRNA (pseudouridine(1915)-N(3))-methyltransferase RlmH [Xanthomonadales bacterium]|nr:23S rRNA (pseudouridine(1915)-N(3))-methyltransferase RlmH [Gammaproteobacteria bacterium]MBT8057057.1 23S rRNA (pseudouridine(1915)-N(3))-methyltransferase RlmH [Gammaproteobacteria bacterium]NNL05543.1 23S rRNA (pseudouridine(1915)-N(3))-methyltransferase RlmH [Xanthomonadales bacterium]